MAGCADPPASLDAGAVDATRGQALFDARVAVPDAQAADAAPPPDPGTGCAAVEACDGADTDCDGQVDEGCGCDPAASACFAGPPAARGVGECRDGLRGCDANGELFGPCEGSVGPAEEVCQDGLDQDCDGRVDEGCPCVGGELEICENGGDDDCDGQVDEGCGCGEEVCADRADNDCDGRFDEEPCRQPMGNEPCNPNLRRACFEENPAHIGVGPCAAGMQVCDWPAAGGPARGRCCPPRRSATRGWTRTATATWTSASWRWPWCWTATVSP
ncbi:MAG: MopE-related protein [bacterium]